MHAKNAELCLILSGELWPGRSLEPTRQSWNFSLTQLTTVPTEFNNLLNSMLVKLDRNDGKLNSAFATDMNAKL